MSSGVVPDREEITAAWDELEAAFDKVAALNYDVLTHPELLSTDDRIERIARRLPTLERPLLARLTTELSPTALGAKSWKEVLRTRLRISGTDAARRLEEIADLGPRTSMTGQPLNPLLAQTAAAQADGRINADHVRHIREFFHKLPHSVDAPTRDQCEATLVRGAVGGNPDALREAAGRLAYLIDQDGPMPDDAERARKRGIWIGRQGSDGMTPFKGMLDPQGRATWEAIAAKWAAPGMCNPDDPTPCVSGTPSEEQIQGDTRSIGQRNHDAFTAIARNALCSGELGQHNGLPVTIIVSTTLQDLERGAGCAVTGGGSLLPMSDVIRMASHAHHYLTVFDKHTNEVLYLARAKRLASVGQRIALHSRDVGCTFPDCPVPGYGTQVHHIKGWAKHNGQTNIDEEVLACKGHNLLAEAGWTVRIINGIVHWIPPPHLDTGQNRINTYHHPDRLLKDPEGEDDSGTTPA